MNSSWYLGLWKSWQRALSSAVRQNDDMELAAVYTRRNPETVSIATPGVAVRWLRILRRAMKILMFLILCGGSATDLPEQTPKYAALYNVVDSFDTHAKIPTHFANVDEAVEALGTGPISCGWDPGLFSLNRLYANCILPEGADYTFWVEAFLRGIPMRFVAFLALPMLVNTPFPFPRRWKRFVRAQTPSSLRAKSIRVSVWLFWKRALTLPR